MWLVNRANCRIKNCYLRPNLESLKSHVENTPSIWTKREICFFLFIFFFCSAQKLILPVDFYSDTTISSLRYYHVLFMCLPALIILAYPIYEVFLQAVAQEENVFFSVWWRRKNASIFITRISLSSLSFSISDKMCLINRKNE